MLVVVSSLEDFLREDIRNPLMALYHPLDRASSMFKFGVLNSGQIISIFKLDSIKFGVHISVCKLQWIKCVSFTKLCSVLFGMQEFLKKNPPISHFFFLSESRCIENLSDATNSDADIDIGSPTSVFSTRHSSFFLFYLAIFKALSVVQGSMAFHTPVDDGSDVRRVIQFLAWIVLIGKAFILLEGTLRVQWKNISHSFSVPQILRMRKETQTNCLNGTSATARRESFEKRVPENLRSNLCNNGRLSVGNAERLSINEYSRCLTVEWS